MLCLLVCSSVCSLYTTEAHSVAWHLSVLHCQVESPGNLASLFLLPVEQVGQILWQVDKAAEHVLLSRLLSDIGSDHRAPMKNRE